MHLLDLPDEILLAIFSYCIVVDPLFVRHLNFTVESCKGEISAMPDQIVDRVCHAVRPRINDRIIALTLDSHTMERAALTPSIVFPLYRCSNFHERRLFNLSLV